jgi:chaperone BCS1
METSIFSQLFTGTALLAVFTYLGFQLKSLPEIIWGQIKKRLIYTVHIEETSQLFSYFEVWLNKFHEDCYRNVNASINNDYNEMTDNFPKEITRDEQKSRKELLSLGHFSDVFVLHYNGKRILITKGREKFENAQSIRSAFYNNFKLEAWNGKSEILGLLDEVIEYNNSIRKIKQIIYTNNSYGDWLNFGEVYGKSIDNIVLKEKHAIIDNITDFISKEQWYLERGLSYKRGYLFYGSPGNGKTSLCLALAKHFNKDIQFLNLNDIEKDVNLFLIFNNIRNNSILVIEDVDTIFGTRDNGKSKISFSALLNCMDGAFSKHGIVTIMTTNHIDKIDPALIREGRIDMKVNIDNPDTKMVKEYLSIFYGKEVYLNGNKCSISMCKIQEICLQNKNDAQKAIEMIYG